VPTSLARNSAAAEKFLSKFKIWIFVKKSSDFNQNIPPIYTRRAFRLAPPAAGLCVCQDFERILLFAKIVYNES